MNYKEEFLRYYNMFEKYSHEYFDNKCSNDSVLSQAMQYAYFAGGKRLRPVLLLYTVDFLGGNVDRTLPFAFALECIHTSSLIHDDLPAMDNDLLRRGKPTCHAVYGEALALLAGDGLITLAYETATEGICDKNTQKAANILARYAGYNGMLLGQVLDKTAEQSGGNCDDLLKIYKYKTAGLLTAPLVMGSLLCGGKMYLTLEEFGLNLGLLFQAVDDYLDVTSTTSKLGKTAGKDEKENKLTYVKIFGKEQTQKYINELSVKLKNIAENEIKSEFLKCFIDNISPSGRD